MSRMLLAVITLTAVFRTASAQDWRDIAGVGYVDDSNPYRDVWVHTPTMRRFGVGLISVWLKEQDSQSPGAVVMLVDYDCGRRRRKVRYIETYDSTGSYNGGYHGTAAHLTWDPVPAQDSMIHRVLCEVIIAEARRGPPVLRVQSAPSLRWRYVAVTEKDDTILVDRETIVRTTGKVEAWVKIVFATASEAEPTAASVMQRWEIDCRLLRIRTKASEYADIDGKVLGGNTPPLESPWRSITPESIGENLRKLLCSKAPVGARTAPTPIGPRIN